MRVLQRLGKTLLILSIFAVSSFFALRYGTGGLWRGLEAAHAVTAPGKPKVPYDLAQLSAVNETLKIIRDKYVEPKRINPRQMFVSALDEIQKEVAQVIVLHEEKAPTVKVRVGTDEQEFRVDNIQGPWDVSARLREVFVFLQQHLKDTEVDLRDIEYAACNGMLSTLDPHSVFMSPEAYRDMNVSTSGHFGGLGIVISIRDQMLTVMRPMPETPAGRAGLRRLDRITKINNESTLNMPLDDAVARLRGKPGTQVTIWVHREGKEGWAGSRPFVLTREEIRIRSVEGRLLSPGIGYVRLRQFQSSTSRELEESLSQLRSKEPLRGLVLDLRGNPGGLLDQAAKVADQFLDSGVIVATVGNAEGREEKRATPRGTEPPYPILVLTNPSSASASEIVAGALKNHGRALIVGQRTFGKGTVQLVFPNVTRDGAALKLTIAQYLTPGDVSIQGVGVTPDIELDPMTADTLEMDLFRSELPFRERDLDKSLSNEARRDTERPALKVRYNLPESERAEMRERGADLDDEFREDFPIRLAKQVVAKLPVAKRPDQLSAVRSLVESIEKKEVESITADLARLGVDWSSPPADAAAPAQSDLEVSVRTDQKDDTTVAGGKMKLEVRVKNHGAHPLYQLRATTKSDSGYYDEKELVFGKLDAGQERTVSVPLGWCDVEGRKVGSTRALPQDAKRVCTLPKDAVTRQDVVKVRFEAAGDVAPKEAEFRPTVKALERPVFAYSYQVVDNRPGNGDGQITKGEGVSLYLTIKNVGRGPSLETQANIRNLTGDGILLRAGRFDVSNLKPGDEREVVFTLDVLEELAETFVKVELSIIDQDLRVVASEKLTLPVAQQGLSLGNAAGFAKAKDSAAVRAQPVASGLVVGELAAGKSTERLGNFGAFTKVSLGQGRFGFVESAALEDAQGPAAAGAFKPSFVRSPPLLEVNVASLATRADTVRLEGQATDLDRVLDTYIFVGTSKVFYQSNKNASDPRKMRFEYDVKLQPGVNVITVVSRENEDTATRKTLVVRRDGPNGEALPTPKRRQFGADWEFGGDE
ncbi:MAG: PDZ domain-containing protein [Polyangiaceae bacterium]|nr:PDZ domain-containing protein [Polyangiaceae bacterium]MCW5789601.1 PDZ domain-containing protein [Polyangiaceae bacterium]